LVIRDLIHGFNHYENLVTEHFVTLIKNLNYGEDRSVAEMLRFHELGRMAAHTSFHANLQVPEEVDDTVRELLRQNFDIQADKIRTNPSFWSAYKADEYRKAISAALNNEEKVSMRVGDVVSHNFSSRQELKRTRFKSIDPLLGIYTEDRSADYAARIVEDVKPLNLPNTIDKLERPFMARGSSHLVEASMDASAAVAGGVGKSGLLRDAASALTILGKRF
jgi:hypothetical protein